MIQVTTLIGGTVLTQDCADDQEAAQVFSDEISKLETLASRLAAKGCSIGESVREDNCAKRSGIVVWRLPFTQDGEEKNLVTYLVCVR